MRKPYHKPNHRKIPTKAIAPYFRSNTVKIGRYPKEAKEQADSTSFLFIPLKDQARLNSERDSQRRNTAMKARISLFPWLTLARYIIDTTTTPVPIIDFWSEIRAPIPRITHKIIEIKRKMSTVHPSCNAFTALCSLPL
ncbi:hypothetical protein [Thermococcus cleftensis]|uniref:hypothetical protein n=1 Tax=Thermococcus cleftensis (strain DSM 27260 / KACC 17922 / CL1) TaxID=163003 RepID=UPI0016517665|nr:hypothetical protein [Thermococcus cleftensis]